MSDSLRTYVAELHATAPWRVWLALALMCCVGLTEGIGLLLLVPLLQAVGLNVGQGGIGQIEQWTSAAFATLGIRPTVLGVLFVYVLTISAQSALHRWQAVVSSALDERFLLHLRQRLYRAILNMGWLFFARRRASDFTHALTTEIDRVGELSYSLFSLFVHTLVGSVYLLLAFHLSPAMTGLAAASGVALLLLLRRYTRAARAAGEELTEANESLFAAATEHLGGLKTTKSYGAEGRNFGIFSIASERVAQAEIRTIRSYADARAWFKVGAVLILSVVVYLSMEMLRLSTAEVLLLLFLFSRVVPKFSAIQQDQQCLINALPAYHNVRKQISSCEAAAEPSAAAIDSVALEHDVRLDGVSFGYHTDGRASVLLGLYLVIPAFRTTAITGPSGTGKTTVADLVMGLIVPEHGRVLVDGRPLGPRQIRAWRDQIGYVAQDTALFHDSIRSNLLWACPAADEEEMWEALRLAAADRFVAGLPRGLDTVIGDRGVRLSGGERQRLALARALLRKPSVLILDEATNALDSENERRIQQAIEELHGRLTILIITHRLSAIRDADVIYLLESGRAVESGDWSELTAHGRRFAELCGTQGIELGAHPSRATLDRQKWYPV